MARAAALTAVRALIPALALELFHVQRVDNGLSYDHGCFPSVSDGEPLIDRIRTDRLARVSEDLAHDVR
jgi:hypothetical protein